MRYKTMKKKNLILFLILAIAITVNAQTGYKRTYAGSVELGGGPGINSLGGVIGLGTIHGVNLSPYTYLGGGVLFNYHTKGEKIAAPLFVDFKIAPMTGRIVPYIDLRGGYSFFDKEGFYMSPGLGVKCQVTNKICLTFSVAYQLQKTEDESANNTNGQTYNSSYKEGESYKNFLFRVGYTF